MYEDMESIKKKIEEIKSDTQKKEALTAAYALNMCTVSVSQIVDYADPIILDQEYDAILNNLNIQKMPKKEEALLVILEKILDVITFFRIDKVERELVDKEYQFKMKNAVWNAVPNFGLIVSGGNLISMAISLASQVGIGYMNYRRAKAENTLEYEREMWQLEKTAIEQLNALRRQLFDTAWRLSDTYDYDDEYRLTERQISEYNQILMDADPIRKYERLDAIKDKFLAYPPFWYQFAHTANDIACLAREKFTDDSVCKAYKKKAKELFEEYRNLNVHGLLRDDPITCACALEHIDLLDPNNEAEKKLIGELLETVNKYSGGASDILQLAAFAYLRIDDSNSAIPILRRLVNADYNTNFNAQLLSRIYVHQWLQTKKENLLSDHMLLSERVEDRRYMFPWPNSEQNEDELEAEYNATMLYMLKEKYFYGLKNFFEKCAVEFNKKLPVWWESQETNEYGEQIIPAYCFDNTEDAYNLRLNLAKRAFLRNEKATEFRMQIADSEFWYGYLDLFEEMLQRICALDCVTDPEDLESKLKDGIAKQKGIIDECIGKLYSTDSEFTIDDYTKLHGVSFISFALDFIKKVYAEAFTYLSSLSQTTAFSNGTTLMDAERNLREFCLNAGIAEPDVLLFETRIDTGTKVRRFGEELLGANAQELSNQHELVRSMIEKITESQSKVITKPGTDKIVFLIKGKCGFNEYFTNKAMRKQLNGTSRSEAIAVLDDRTTANIDLIFTTKGIYPVVKDKIKAFVSYTEVSTDKIADKKIGLSGMRKKSFGHYLLEGLIFYPALVVEGAHAVIKGDNYENKYIDAYELSVLIKELATQSKTKAQEIESNEVKLLPEVFEEVREKVLLNEEELDVESLLFGSSQTMEGRDNNEAQMYQSYGEMVVTKKSRKTKKAK